MKTTLLLSLLLVASHGALAAPRDLVLDSGAITFAIATNTGAYEILDRANSVVWRSNPFATRFGEVECEAGGAAARLPLGPCSGRRGVDRLELTFRPETSNPEAWLRVLVEAPAGQAALTFAYEAAPELRVRSVRLLDHALSVRAEDRGGVIVPVREGLLIPADSGKEFNHTFTTYAYEGCHMAMFGVVKGDTAVLVHWRDPYVAMEVRSAMVTAADGAREQVIAPSLVLQGSARRCRMLFLGRGDHVTIGKAYREVARREGWFVPWEAKIAGDRGRARLLGASNYKLWSVLDREMNEESTQERRVTVNWTFDEAAQVAEHLRRDLQLDKVLFLMGGWIHRGYDNQHPDILPAAPECGGDAAFADCVRRIKAVGYVCGLHDNYQDIYRDSPSWNEDLIMKQRDGTLARGGVWAGGRAYLTCSSQAVNLALRAQNLPAVKQLTGADAYFIDTTYAAGLMECFDPKHPLSRHDDLYWKQVISDRAREQFGIFGSECGREWAIPHSDFFEGLTGVSGQHFHDQGLEAKTGGIVIPLFEIVYRDTMAMYGKYGYDIHRAGAYVLDHVLWGRPLHYHNVPPHLYWKRSEPEVTEVTPAAAAFESPAPGELRLAYRWNVRSTPARDWRVFVHFTRGSGEIVFQDDHAPAVPSSRWQAGMIESGGGSRSWPQQLEGEFEVRVGLFDPESGQRAVLLGKSDGENRYLVGTLKVSGNTFSFVPNTRSPNLAATRSGAEAFVSGQGGWAEGRHAFDRFVKNTHEILSPLNELTARLPMTDHAFITPDRQVQRTVFSAGPYVVSVTVNRSSDNWQARSSLGGAVELPPFGFLVESSHLVAFHARSWGGRTYEEPVLFTLRSLDGRPLADSERVRVFHGFGAPELTLGTHEVSVPREAVVNVRTGALTASDR